MPIEFFEAPRGTPSTVDANAPSGLAVAYCNASDACSLNKPRGAALGVGQNPTLTDLNGYILMIAGQMDAVMLTKGYQVPVSVASYPEVEGFLSWINAQGAAYLLEVSSPAPQATEVDRLRASFDSAMQMLTDGKFSMDIAVEPQRAGVRAPFITLQPTGETYDPTLAYGATGDGISSATGRGNPRNPYLSRELKF